MQAIADRKPQTQNNRAALAGPARALLAELVLGALLAEAQTEGRSSPPAALATRHKPAQRHREGVSA